jgi:hypothetical protein
MPKLNAAQASELARHFLALAQSIGDYRYRNWQKLAKKDNQQLGDFQWSVLNCGEDMLASSTTLVMDDVKNSLAKIEVLTVKVENTLASLSKIQTIINCAAAIVILGGAVISKNPGTITGAIEALEDAVT